MKTYGLEVNEKSKQLENEKLKKNSKNSNWSDNKTNCTKRIRAQLRWKCAALSVKEVCVEEIKRERSGSFRKLWVTQRVNVIWRKKVVWWILISAIRKFQNIAAPGILSEGVGTRLVNSGKVRGLQQTMLWVQEQSSVRLRLFGQNRNVET